MNTRWIIVLAATWFCLPLEGAARSAYSRWESTVVTLEVTGRRYDFQQPWSRQPQTVAKPAVVLSRQTLLATAEGLANHTVIRAQAGGRGPWYQATVAWVDYPANLALLSVEDPAFWRHTRPVSLSRKIPRDGNLRLLRWRGGSMEARKAEFNRFTVSNPTGGDAAHVVLELNSDIDGAGWGEPLIAGNQLLGLVFGQRGNLCQVLTAPFIQSILTARDHGAFTGLGYFDFTWQQTENPETLRYLKVPEQGRGVVIIDVPERSLTSDVLRPRDVILKVDGFDVDHQGDYSDPLYGHLMLEGLSTRNRWAGHRIPMRIWRDGAPLEIEFTLPPVEGAARLVPESPRDDPPEYVIAGGLIFQPLTRDYLRSWGPSWEQSAPFRLAYYRNEEPSPDRPSLVVLSSILPDPLNLGYQDMRNLIVERINGRRVSRLAELQEALATPQAGFHMLEFAVGETLQRIVLDASQLEESTRRVLSRYGIERALELRASP
jgi:hypothetical protein